MITVFKNKQGKTLVSGSKMIVNKEGHLIMPNLHITEVWKNLPPNASPGNNYDLAVFKNDLAKFHPNTERRLQEIQKWRDNEVLMDIVDRECPDFNDHA